MRSNQFLDNASYLFLDVWEKANDDLRKSAGQRYHSYLLDHDADTSEDKGAKIRVLETLVKVDGVRFIPDAARASLYRHTIKKLAKAKDTPYGWGDEEKQRKLCCSLVAMFHLLRLRIFTKKF